MEPVSWWTIIPISAIVSALVTLTIRYLDKPRPHLVVVRRGLLLPTSETKMLDIYGKPTTIHNYGNGTAYGVRIVGSSCVVGVRMPKAHAFGGDSWNDYLPAIEPGETVVLDVHNLDENSTPRIVITRDRFPSLPALRGLRRVQVFRLDRMLVENPLPPGGFEPRAIPALRRRLGIVAPYGLTARVNSNNPGSFLDE
ncbi:hypothetical protein [Cellulosimicrobium sp. Marseille-Q4280]|uniref:hypothetical protein n=1 Tax=Cellulosimicrobium sp. Marseille-Q4280 TaxID=2937992 RepID=UPI00203D75EA|nr:hypothetical protein [Cellulosimicrobium sp. Marseille-Q4280]